MSDLKLIMEYGGAVRRFAMVPTVEGSDQLEAAKDALLRHCEAKDKRIAELEAELDALKVDAGRFRTWLEVAWHKQVTERGMPMGAKEEWTELTIMQLDETAAIDAAKDHTNG